MPKPANTASCWPRRDLPIRVVRDRSDCRMRVLVNILRKVGKETRVYTTPDGSRVLVLPYGGRVLGLFPPKSEENFYWTNTALKSAKMASQFFEGEQWHNSGGDRTWLAPEIDFFFPNFPK